MKFKYIKSTISAISLILVLGMASCSDELKIGPKDPNISLEFVQDEVFTKIYATMGLTGQKGPDGSGDVPGIDEGFSAFSRLIFTMNEYPSDEAICAWTGDVGIPELNSMKWGASDGQVRGLYGRLTFNVTLCNYFLEETAGATDDKSVKQRAEVRFMRAMNYFYLMDFFANPPFTTVMSDELPIQIQRADLFTFIEDELIESEADMFESRQAPFGRADVVANWLLRARMYLNAQVYTGSPRWADAKTYADKVMKSSYDLADNYKELFMADNDENVNAKKEIILPIRQDGIQTRSWGGSLYLIAATRATGMTPWGTSEQWAGVRARKALIDKFFESQNKTIPLGAQQPEVTAAANDDRALFYTGGNIYIKDGEETLDTERSVTITNVGTFTDGVSVVKWTNLRSDGASPHDNQYTDTDIPFMRLGEAYLIYAEASLRSGTDGGEALSTVNLLRTRANATPLETISLDEILNERSRELYFEGHRRMDLVRYGYFTGSKYIWDWKGGVADGTAVNSMYNVYPIPTTDLNANKNLVQNKGY